MALAVTAPSLSSQAAATTSNQDLGSKDVFLKMLIAQMKNQDPQNPADATQMSSQLAQFNMVEQQISTNDYLQQIAGNQGGSSSLDIASAGYLGHSVTINQDTIVYSGTTVNFSANLSSNAQNTYISVNDASGSPVRTMSVSTLQAGDQQFTWDGRDDSGIKVPTGPYSINIQALDAYGQVVAATPQSSGVVEAVRAGPSGVELVVNGIATSLANVSEVRI